MLAHGSELQAVDLPGHGERAPGRTVLSGAFALLEALAGAEGDLGLTEAAKRAGLPKSTAYRLLEQMCEIGAAEHRSRGYGVGPLVGWLGKGRGHVHASIRDAVGKAAIRLAKLSRADVVVCVPSGAEVVVVATYAGHSARLPAVRPGTVLPPSAPLAEVLNDDRAEPGAFLSAGQADTLSCAAAAIHSHDGRIVAGIGVLTSSAKDLSWLGQLVTIAAVEAGRQLAGMFT